jgi:hypothetical protein
MNIALAAYGFLVDDPFYWRADWVWGTPLILLTVLIHVSGLALIGQKVVRRASLVIERRHPAVAFIGVVGSTTLSAIVLHGAEACIWALAYFFLGALPKFRSCMLYSLNAMTSYGHENLSLEDHWHLLGALEALNGTLLFGLSTAFLFAVIQKVWFLGDGK